MLRPGTGYVGLTGGFQSTSDEELREALDKLKGQGMRQLILDLRGNGGGRVDSLQYLLGYFFAHDVKVGETKGRAESRPMVATTRGDKAYKGKLVVLVDSRSASAAEIFARAVQLEKRGTVIGDRTAGAVTAARHFSHIYLRTKGKKSDIQAVDYGVSVTVSTFVMSDGQSLERVGVTPDETLLPTPVDLQAGTDTQLLRAAELLGVKLDLKKPKEVRFN